MIPCIFFFLFLYFCNLPSQQSLGNLQLVQAMAQEAVLQHSFCALVNQCGLFLH